MVGWQTGADNSKSAGLRFLEVRSPFGYRGSARYLSSRRSRRRRSPLIDMQFTVCSQCLEKKYLVSDSCPAEAWYNSDFLEADFWGVSEISFVRLQTCGPP
jgi:hypothetical protein